MRLPRLRIDRADVCSALLGALLLTGLGKVWSVASGHAMWAAGVRPATGLMALDAALLALALALAFRFGGERLRRRLPALMAAALVAAQVAFLLLAWPTVSAPMPWGVDHSSFLYRLHNARASFPALGGYDPRWNGGAEQFFGVTSGIHGYAALVSPLLAFLEPHRFHGPALFFWLFAGFPWLAVLSLRAAGARWTAALAGGMLATACTRSSFLFGWQYGILGGMTTVGLTLPLAALGWRVVVLRRRDPAGVVALAVAAWLSCLWTPGFLTCAGLALSALLFARSWTRRSFAAMACAAALALALLAPWIWTVLGPSRGIVDFVADDAARPALRAALAKGLGLFGRHLFAWHPAVLAFGFAGTFLAASPRLRRWTAPVLLAIACVAVGAAFKPHSQLDRVAFQMSAVAAFPAALLCGRVLSRRAPDGAARRWTDAAAKGVVLAALLLGLRVAGAHAAGAGGLPVRVLEPPVAAFADWIRDNVPEGGRLAFMGVAQNNVGGGTVAYLPILSGREMMAEDYYNFPRGMSRHDYPPKPYKKSTEALLGFSRAYGITHWAVSHRRYVRFCEENPGHFALATTFRCHGPEIRVYRILDPWAEAPTRLLEGEGEVDARENRILVRPADPSADRLVLRYNWRDGLACRTPGASVEPFEVDGRLRFVAVRPGGAPEVEIVYRPSFRPLAPDFDGSFHH